jgi:hypothetical protein
MDFLPGVEARNVLTVLRSDILRAEHVASGL